MNRMIAAVGCLILLAFAATAAAQPEKATPALAVLAFDFAPRPDETKGELVADLLATGLGETHSVVDRKDLKKILAEQELSLRGLVAAADAVKVGKLVGAKFLVAGRVIRLGDTTVAAVRVVSVETGRFQGVNASQPGDADAGAVAERTVQELTRTLPGLLKELSRPQVEQPAVEPVGPVGGAALTVAVLNFENQRQGDGKLDWLGKGLADLTIGDLASQGLRVVSREQMQDLVNEMRLRKEAADASAVARVLKASRAVQGTFGSDGSAIRLTAAIQEVATGKSLHTVAVSGPAADVLVLQKKLSAELADVLAGKKPGATDPAHLPRWTESLKASELLYQGIDRFDRGEYLDAWGLFRRALRQDARYADALYWSGRMMYYLQEYHQSRPDLEQFAVANPRHPRVGDAMIEIVNGVQQTAAGADEVLAVLAFAASLAPQAAVHNQLAGSQESTVGLYCAGLMMQILESQGKYREAARFFGEQLRALPVDHWLYWVGWHEFYRLNLRCLGKTAEALPLPAPPRPTWLRAEWSAEEVRIMERSLIDGQGLHPTFGGMSVRERPGLTVSGDSALRQKFHALTPEKPTVEIDFAAEPLTPKSGSGGADAFARHFVAGPGQYLTALEIEVRFRPEPRLGQNYVLLRGSTFPGHYLMFPIGPEGKLRQEVKLPSATRLTSIWMQLAVGKSPGNQYPPTAVLGWSVTGKFAAIADAAARSARMATATVRVRPGLPFAVSFDGQPTRTLVEKSQTFNLAPGDHNVAWVPWTPGSGVAGQSFRLAPGEAIDIDLAGRAKVILPLELAEPLTRFEDLSTPYDVFRLGPALGDQAGLSAHDVHFFEDRGGRWIVTWHVRRDLFLTWSDDRGQTWAPTRPLPPPVNSAHGEQFPVLGQGADGRYVLLFTSDRNRARAHAVYACWSDDLTSFSAPVLINGNPGRTAAFLQRADGTYLAYLYLLPKKLSDAALPGQWHAPCTVSASADLIDWAPPVDVSGGESPVSAFGVTEQDGQFLAVTLRETGKETPPWYIQNSSDGIQFGRPSPLPFRALGRVILRRDRAGMLAIVSYGDGGAVVFRPTAAGIWKRTIRVEAAPNTYPFAGAAALTDRALHVFHLHLDRSAEIRLNADDWTAQAPRLRMLRTTLAPQPPNLPQPRSFLIDRSISCRIVRPSEVADQVKRLSDPSLPVRLAAAEALAAVDREGPQVTKVLRAVLREGDVASRTRAVAALGQLQSAAESAAAALDDALGDADETVAFAACCALAELQRGLDRTMPLLRKGLADSRNDRRMLSARALGRYGALAREAFADLRPLLKDPAPGVRPDAVLTAALLEPDPKELIAVLEPCFMDEKLVVRQLACQVAPAAGAAAVPSLVRALTDEDLGVRRIASAGLQLLGPKAKEAAAALAAAAPLPANRPLREQIVHSLYFLGPDAVPQLIQLMKSDDRELRREAAVTLNAFGENARDGVPALIDLLAAPDVDLRMRAAWILGRIGPEARAAVPALTAGRMDPAVRVAFDSALTFIARD